MKLTKIHTLTAQIELVTGLKIGGSNDTMQIGGVDNPVIRDPRTHLPYIPGSSLKGKLRSLLEWQLGLVTADGNTYGLKNYKDNKDNKNNKLFLQLFGYMADAKNDEHIQKELGIGRLSFSDAFLCIEKDWKSNDAGKVLEPNTLIETKMETAIDRITGTAKAGSLRTGERVSAGYLFEFKLNIKEFEGDQFEDSLLPLVFKGLKLLELDSLGGSGSRGYGKVRFKNMQLDTQDKAKEFAETDAFK